MERALGGLDNLVMFRNSQAAEGRGTLIHLTRNLVVFEIYNPYSIVQLSEVLQDLRIMRGERAIYTGRAVVSNLVATGLMVLVSATLVDAWSDLEGMAPGPKLREEVQGFVREWEAGHSIRPPYQLAVSNIRGFLGELSRWLEQVEVSAGTADRSAPETLQREFTLEVEAGIGQKLVELFTVFEREAAQIGPEESIGHKAFARREVHPLTLISPFVHRTFSKPLGYAGDYEMVNMILRDPLEGPNAYARIMNAFVLRSDGAQAHRNRIDKLVGYLGAEVRRLHGLGRPLRVLNIGCGPAGEIQRFIRTDTLADRCEFHLLDFNQETLDCAKTKIGEAIRDSGRRPRVEFYHRSVHELLKDAARGAIKGEGADPEESNEAGLPTVDLVYCAGLFDYLSDRICKRLLQLFYGRVAPGGMVVATNVHPRNSVRYFLEHILEWHLIYRTEAEMASLAPDASRHVVTADETGVNVFLEIRRPL